MKKLGFGCMRLPLLNGTDNNCWIKYNSVVWLTFLWSPVFAILIQHMFTWMEEVCSLAIREGLVKRYPRNSFVLTNKLSGELFSVRR